jgi:anthranilate synthase component 1
MNAITLTQRGQRLPADVQTPISLFLGLVGEKPGILLESAEVDGRLGRFSVIAWDFRLRVDIKGGRLRVHAKGHTRLAPLEELSGAP